MDILRFVERNTMRSVPGTCHSHILTTSRLPLTSWTLLALPFQQLFDQGFLYVVVYNAQAANRTIPVRLPMNASGAYRVEPMDGNVSSQVIQTTPTIEGTPVLIFSSGLIPPLGAVVLRIQQHTTKSMLLKGQNREVVQKRVLGESVIIDNGMINASFDRSTGMLIGMSLGNVTVPIQQTWGYYTSFDSAIDEKGKNTTTQNSGAYIFRPSTNNITVFCPKPNGSSFVNTAVGIEVHATFAENWVRQITKVYANEPFVDIEYSIGPIPVGDGRGKEVISRLMTPIRSQDLFGTDSNGRDFLQRRRDRRPSWPLAVHEPVAGNYYPVTAGIFIEDANASLAIVVDRAQGGASLAAGQIEIMVQRRTLADDARGVDEPLNETMGGMTPYPPFGNNTRLGEGIVVKGKHRILVGHGNTGAELARSQMDGMFLTPPVFVVPSKNPKLFETGHFSGLRTSLPRNVMLITFDQISTEIYLVRLGHQFGKGESKVLSEPVTIDLTQIFVGFKVTKIQEMSLTSNQDLKTMEERRYSWMKREDATRFPSADNNFSAGETKISLAPLEIRTFEFTMTTTTQHPSNSLFLAEE